MTSLRETGTRRSRHRLVVRVDGGSGVGFGHLVRCASIARQWRGHSTLVSDRLPDNWREITGLSQAAVRPADAITELCGRDAALVVDGYEFDELAQSVEGFGSVTAIDDFGVGRQGPALDLLVDQSDIATNPLPPSYASAQRVLRGQRYAMLRPEFDDCPDTLDMGRRLLVSAGGSSTPGLERWVSDVLRDLDDDVDVVWLHDTEKVAELMASCTVALAAAGSTMWELCRMGVPAVYFSLAENQDRMLDVVESLDFGHALGPWRDTPAASAALSLSTLLADDERRDRYRQMGRRLVDGQGSKRVATAIRSSLLSVRVAIPADKHQYLTWANDEQTRAASFDSEVIAPSTHDRWFERKMSSPNVILSVVEDDGVSIGQFRVDLVGAGRGEVDISVDRSFRGCGLGSAVIEAASRHAFSARDDLETLHAKVLVHNDASRRAFIAADYYDEGVASSGDDAWVELSRSRDRLRDG